MWSMVCGTGKQSAYDSGTRIRPSEKSACRRHTAGRGCYHPRFFRRPENLPAIGLAALFLPAFGHFLPKQPSRKPTANAAYEAFTMHIPESCAAFAEKFKRGGRLKTERDAFGQPPETEPADVLPADETAARGAEYLARFLDAFEEEDLAAAEKAGRLKTWVCFATDGAGNPFCMDFSHAPDCPAVVWWDDAELVWRTTVPLPSKTLPPCLCRKNK
ncbi:SMI1/KNR4 family protein [Kingella potus]|uniref:SMI1/KNR4 family protein n=1 Tax=Kingella potus TaxID=265175 RepID=UPI00314044E4